MLYDFFRCGFKIYTGYNNNLYLWSTFWKSKLQGASFGGKMKQLYLYDIVVAYPSAKIAMLSNLITVFVPVSTV